MFKTNIAIVFWFLFLLCRLYSQPVKTDVYAVFTNFTIENGLSNNSINDIYQDKLGYIWLATQNGLNRFDGHTFVQFFNIINDSLSISSNEISSITGDDFGNLWIGTTNGLNFYNRHTGTFTRFFSNLYELNSIRHNAVRKLFMQNDSLLWIETLDGSLTQLQLKSNKFSHFKHAQVTQPYYRYHALRTDRSGKLWLGGRGTPVYRFDPNTSEFTAIQNNPLNPKRKRDNDLADIVHTSNGNCYIGGTDGFYQLNPNTEEVVKLLASSTFSLLETETGNVLLGTGNGLFEYNAKLNEFIRYTNDIDNPKSLIDNHINKVYCDKDLNIWIGTEKGLSFLKRNRHEINYYFHIPGNNNTLSGNHVTALLQDSKKRIWIGTENQGLNLWDTVNNSFKHFLHNSLDANSLAANQVSKIIEDKNGNLWIGLWAGVGFNKFEPEKNNFTRYAVSFDSKKRDWYNDLHIDSTSNFWLGFWGSFGLQKFNTVTNKIEGYDFFSGISPTYALIKNVQFDSIDHIFVRTTGNVLYFYSVKDKKFSAHVWKESKSKNPYINSHYLLDVPINFNSVLSSATNRKGTTVIATDAGLLSCNNLNNAFNFQKNSKLKIEKVFNQNSSDNFWAITNKRLIALNPELEILANYPLPNQSFDLNKMVFVENLPDTICTLDSMNIYTILPGKSKIEVRKLPVALRNFAENMTAFWGKYLLMANKNGLYFISILAPEKYTKLEIAGASHILQHINFISKLERNRFVIISNFGIAILNAKTKKINILKPELVPPEFDFTAQSATLANNTLYISTQRIIFSIDLQNFNFELVNKPDGYMLSSRLTTCLASNYSNYLWIGTSDKGLNRMNKQTGKFECFYVDTVPNSLQSNHITALLVAQDNTVWVGTDKGLCYFDQQKKQIYRYKLSTEEIWIKSLIEYKNGELWIGTTQGIFKTNTLTGKTTQFNETDGLPFSEFGKAAFKLANGNILMSGPGGIIEFSPEKIAGNEIQRRIRFSGFYLFGKPLNFNVNTGDTIKLNHDENYFELHFSSLEFKFPGKITYAYHLTGMQAHWMYTSENSVNFSNLPSGNYKFSITVPGYEEQPEHHSVLYIQILPPFYKTAWFIMLNILLITGVAVTVLYVYIQRINTAKRNIELEQKLLSSQMNPHFIFNSLTAIQSFLYKCEPEVAGNYLADFSRLIRLILDNSRSETISMDKEILTLKLYLSLQQLRFSHRFDYAIDVDFRINKKATFIPPMLSQPFIENSIEHGVMHLTDKGNIFVVFRLFDDCILIEITDDGIGIRSSEALYENKERHISRATEITRERLANLSKKSGRKFTVEITDRQQTEGVSGTRVQLNIPYSINNSI